MYILGLGPYIKEFERQSNYEIHPEQVKLLVALKNSTAHWNLLEAPMGSGKTAIMISLGLSGQGKSLFIIRTQIYTTWISELKKFGFTLNQNPKKSDVLIVHTKYPKHRDLVLDGDTVPDRIKIIVTTWYYIDIYRGRFLEKWVTDTFESSYFAPKSRLVTTAKGKVIIDEAHLMGTSFAKKFARWENANFYLFSASSLNFNSSIMINMRGGIFRCRIKSNSKKGYPKLLTFNEPATGSFESDVHRMITDKLKSEYTHITVFSSWKLRKLREFARNLNKTIGYKTLVFNNTAPTILARWKKAKKGLLLCNYLTSSEGANFSETDCALFFRFDSVSSEKARQCMGRIRRKNSLHKKIMVYLMTEKDLRVYVRSKLNEIYALNLKMEYFKKKSHDSMAQIIYYLIKDGHDLHKLSNEDILRIFTTDHEQKPNVDVGQLTLPIGDVIAYSQL